MPSLLLSYALSLFLCDRVDLQLQEFPNHVVDLLNPLHSVLKLITQLLPLSSEFFQLGMQARLLFYSHR